MRSPSSSCAASRARKSQKRQPSGAQTRPAEETSQTTPSKAGRWTICGLSDDASRVQAGRGRLQQCVCERQRPSTCTKHSRCGRAGLSSRPSNSKMVRWTLALLAVGASGFAPPATPRSKTALAASGSQIAYRIRSVALRPTTNGGCGCFFNETSLFAAAESRRPTSTHALCTTGESASPTRTRAACA